MIPTTPNISIFKFQNTLWLATGLVLGLGILSILKFDTEWRMFLTIGLAMPFVLMMSRDIKQVCLALLILSIPINADVNFIYLPHHGGASGLGINLIDVPLLCLYLLWIIERARDRKSLTEKATPAMFPLTGFFIIVLLSMLNATDIQFSLFEVVRMFKAILIFYFIASQVREEKEVRIILTFLLIGLLMECVISFFQGYMGQGAGLSIVGESEKIASQELDSVGNVTRIWGTFGSSNIFAFYLQFILPVPIALLFCKRVKTSRLLLLIVSIAGTIALLFTLSRGGWLGFALSMILVIGFYVFRGSLTMSKIAVILITILIAALLLLGFSDIILARIHSDDGESAYIRIPMMQVAWTIIKAHPILGIGINNYTEVMRTYDPTSSRISFWFDYPVHNQFLLIAAEVGVFGLLSFLIFIFFLFRTGLFVVKRTPPGSFYGHLAIGVMAGLAGFLVHCLGDFPLLSYFSLFWVLSGLLCALANQIKKSQFHLKKNAFVKFIINYELCHQPIK